ncbi:isoprenylcysteine carboxylmethyltransferase family protein [Phyllobacterium sp. LjRoot231]|uniref:methyltransferase family protein n=1 Tax=Phyllobacterium sp. LjRoot231 TaxID=3342289 RepID=UPI003ECE6DF3
MPSLAHVQTARKIVLAAAFLFVMTAFFLTRSAQHDIERDIIQKIGWTAIVSCILGRTWCSLYIGGLKNKSVIKLGPYSVVRNPLYVFSVLGAIGVGLSSGSILFGPLIGVLVFAVFHIVIRYEERHLSWKLGDDYIQYKARVPRWLPNPLLWRDARVLEVSPRMVTRVFLDAMIFILAIPFFEALERLQDAGITPILMLLP